MPLVPDYSSYPPILKTVGAYFICKDIIEPTISGNCTYICKNNIDLDFWFFTKICDNQFSYASKNNNSSITTYSGAFDNYSILNYGTYEETLP